MPSKSESAPLISSNSVLVPLSYFHWLCQMAYKGKPAVDVESIIEKAVQEWDGKNRATGMIVEWGAEDADADQTAEGSVGPVTGHP